MNPHFRALLPWFATAGLLLPAPGWGESQFRTQAPGSSGSLDFRIVIPAVVRVIENSHPTELRALASGGWSGQQRLTVLSNMKRGFCVTLRVAKSQLSGWRLLNTSDPGGVTLQAVADGYRLCAPHAGRHTLLLQHEFDSAQTDHPSAMRWPVQTELVAM